MPIEILPRSITIYPDDSQDFTLSAQQPPSFWTRFAYFQLQSDYSVKPTNTSDAVAGGLQLRSGDGSVEFTLDSRSLPGASESIGFLLGINATGTSPGSYLLVFFSATQYKLYDNSGLISGTTTTYTAVAGDHIKLEVFGNTLRFYLNDELKYTKTYSSTNPYPVRYLAYISAAWATDPDGNRLLAPMLTGDWQTTEEYLNWNVPPDLLGSFTVNTQRNVATIRLHATCKPGTYLITGAIGATGTFTANATTNELTLGGTYPVLAVNDAVRIGSLPGGTLPTPLNFETVYYVKTYSSGVLTLSLTPGGATLDLTSTGTGWIMRNADLLLQYANAVITVPAFEVLGIPPSNNVIVQPGATVNFQTTYDRKQQIYTDGTSYITRAVSAGGGAFDAAGNYLATSTAGTYTLTFTAAGQTRIFTVTIPSTLTPDPLYVAPNEPVVFTTTMGGTNTWSVSGGSLAGSDQQVRTFTAPSGPIGQVIRVKVVNNATSETLYRDVEILDSLPAEFNLPGDESEVGADMLLEYPDSGRNPWARQKSEAGFIPESIPVVINNLDLTEYQAIRTFHDQYWTAQKRFFIEDRAEARRLAVRFDSKMTKRPNACNHFDVAFRVRKA